MHTGPNIYNELGTILLFPLIVTMIVRPEFFY